MLLVIMTRSLIRLDSIVRANRHDDRRGRARTESDNDITRGCRGYNTGTRDYDSITDSYRRERDRGITDSYSE